jgi:alpha,alpha-trehalase
MQRHPAGTHPPPLRSDRVSMTSPALPAVAGTPAHPLDPCGLYGNLFVDIQEAGIFPDQKTFVDCLPKLPPAEIMAHYATQRGACDLRAFVLEHFLIPETPSLQAFVAESIDHHLEAVWNLLRREPHPVPEGSSLLPLTHPYIIPGGRFRENYYWDSFFAMLGLRASGREALLRSIVDNCADLLVRYGMIPNGNRTYYLSRSQPPVLGAMVQLVAEHDGPTTYARYLPALEMELGYWNDTVHPTRHRVELAGGHVLQRYYDQDESPRPESYANDIHLSARSTQPPAELFRNLRSGAESGWDFSSRWFLDGTDLASIRTTEFAPVDLNCFLFQLEQTLQRAYELAGRKEDAQRLAGAVEARFRAIHALCWCDRQGFFCDVNLRTGKPHDLPTLAGVVPLYTRVATQAQADATANLLRHQFLQPGGLVTTLVPSGEQWDWPNGWAPLQWMAIVGLRHYGHGMLAREIAQRWTRLNGEVFSRTGRLMEKYNVVDLSLAAGGGEYPTQDGFAWTNAVLAQLRKDYPG